MNQRIAPPCRTTPRNDGARAGPPAHVERPGRARQWAAATAFGARRSAQRHGRPSTRPTTGCEPARDGVPSRRARTPTPEHERAQSPRRTGRRHTTTGARTAACEAKPGRPREPPSAEQGRRRRVPAREALARLLPRRMGTPRATGPATNGPDNEEARRQGCRAPNSGRWWTRTSDLFLIREAL